MHVGPDYECVGTALLRVPLRPAVPRDGGETRQLGFTASRPEMLALLECLSRDRGLMAAVHLANPSVARAVGDVSDATPDKDLRRLLVTMLGYQARMRGRSTPFGLFAGICLAHLDGASSQNADRSLPLARRVMRADGGWLRGVVRSLEIRPDVFRALTLVRNPAVRSGPGVFLLDAPTYAVTGPRAPAKRLTLPTREYVAAALESAVGGRSAEDVVAVVHELIGGDESAALTVVSALIEREFLLTSLMPPPDAAHPLRWVAERLRLTDCANPIATALTGLDDELQRAADHCPADEMETLVKLGQLAADACPGLEHVGSPLHADAVLLARVTLGTAVREAIEEAATLIARLALPGPAQRIRDDVAMGHGLGRAVGLRELAAELTDAVSQPAVGLDGDTRTRLLVQAYATAVWEGRDEIDLTDDLLDGLVSSQHTHLPSDMDVYAVIAARDVESLAAGDFRLVLRGMPATPSAGTALARFARPLGPEGERALDVVRQAADAAIAARHDDAAVLADVMFHPLQDGAVNVGTVPYGRTARVVVNAAQSSDPALVQLGPDDLAILAGVSGPLVWSRSLDREVIPRPASMLVPGVTAPPAADLLLSSTVEAVPVPFDWGPLAGSAWLPRVRRGPIIVVPQTWTLDVLPEDGWDAAFADWRERWRLPRHVMFTDGDRGMPLDLDDPLDLWVLRRRTRHTRAVLQEWDPQQWCWFEGPEGRHLAEGVFSVVLRPGSGRVHKADPFWRLREPATRTIMPGGSRLRAIVTGRTAPRPAWLSEALTVVLGRPDESHLWFLTWLDDGTGIDLRVFGEPAELWGTVLPALAGRVGRDGLDMVLTGYRDDAGLGSPPSASAAAEAWAAADTACTLDIFGASGWTGSDGPLDVLDLGVLSVLDLAARIDGVVRVVSGAEQPSTLLSVTSPDRRSFAPRRHKILAGTASPADGLGGVLRAGRGRRGAVTEALLNSLPPRQVPAVASRLLSAHASRVVGPERAAELLAVAAAAEAAATRRSVMLSGSPSGWPAVRHVEAP